MKINKLNKLIPTKENHFAKLDKSITQKGGIYFLFDKDMELIYIGKAKNIRQRIQQHVSDKAIKWGEYEYPQGTTPTEKDEVQYFSYIEDNEENSRSLKELILINIISTKYNRIGKTK